MKQTSCILPHHPHCSPHPDSTVKDSHPSGRFHMIRLVSFKLSDFGCMYCFVFTPWSPRHWDNKVYPILTPTRGSVSSHTPANFFPLWTQWPLQLSIATCLHLCYHWPFPFAASCPASSISLSSTLSFRVIPPSPPNDLQPSVLPHRAFVTDILDMLSCNGWLKRLWDQWSILLTTIYFNTYIWSGISSV